MLQFVSFMGAERVRQVTAPTNGLLPQWSSIFDTLVFTGLAHSAELAPDLSLRAGVLHKY